MGVRIKPRFNRNGKKLEKDKKAAIDAGCESFISKPISRDTLMSIINKSK